MGVMTKTPSKVSVDQSSAHVGGLLQVASPMFPVRAADIAPSRDPLVRSRSASSDGRDASLMIRKSGVRSYALKSARIQVTTSHYHHLPPSPTTPQPWDFYPETTTGTWPEKPSIHVSPGKYTVFNKKSYQESPTVSSLETLIPKLPEQPQKSPSSTRGVIRPLFPRAPPEPRRVSSAPQGSTRTQKLLVQRQETSTSSSVLRQINAAVEETGAALENSPYRGEETKMCVSNDPKRENTMAPLNSKLYSPTSAWKDRRAKSAMTPKRTCFRENVDIIYFDTEERPTEAHVKDSEKLKDESVLAVKEQDGDREQELGENEEPKSDMGPPAQTSLTSTAPSNSIHELERTDQPPSPTALSEAKTKFVVANNICLKQEIRLLPNTEDAFENLLRRDSCRLTVIVQIKESCIKHMTAVKAMSGGRTLVVVTHRSVAGRFLPARHSSPGSEATGTGEEGSMVFIKHVDRLRLPVEINPYAVKAHVHKDWTLRIVAPVRDWLDCPATVLRCRLPLGLKPGDCASAVGTI